MELADPKHPNADQIGPAPGERVLDVGCGCGAATLELTRRVGAAGEVTGVDVSAQMLAHARALAEKAGAAAVFEAVDAQTHAFAAGAFDLVFSRFGLMFFADPAAAFRNLVRALAPGGRLAFICWRTLEENEWFSLPIKVAQDIGIELERAGPDEPGPFSLADAGQTERVLAAAGLVDIAFEGLDAPFVLMPGDALDRVVGFVLEVGPLSRVLDEGDADILARIVPALRAALAPHFGAQGLAMRAASWIVTARRP